MLNAAQDQAIDFRTYYDLERYLFETVSPRFAETHTVSAFDFFCIVIWKSNRAKSKIAHRLLASGKFASLDAAVQALLASICAAQSPRDRMAVLIRDWKFLLPMASAILTVLYPKEFTVYDVRVCESLGDYAWVQNRTNLDHLWDGYSEYKAAVKRVAPSALSLRDKDRWLWGKSFFEQLQRDIEEKFPYRPSRSGSEE